MVTNFCKLFENTVYNVSVVLIPVVCTFSGSGNIVLIHLAAGLGIYFAEHNKGSYKDVWCNFSYLFSL